MQAVEISDEDLLQERIQSNRAARLAVESSSSSSPIAASASSSATDLASSFNALHLSATPASGLDHPRMMSVGFVEESTGEQLRITVDDPEVRSSTFSKYVAYAVTVHPRLPRIINVRRRYNDFCWLREVLVKHYPGYFVPPLPPKKALGRFNDDFLDERQGDLQRFMTRLCADPILPENPAFRMFLCRHENSFEQGCKEVEVALAQELAMAGTLQDRYAKLLPKAMSRALPESLPEEMLSLNEVLNRSNSELMTLLETARLISLKRREQAEEHAKFAQQLQALYKTENQFADRPQPPRSDVAKSFVDWAELNSSSLKPFDACLVNTIKYELQDVQAFLEIIEFRADLVERCQKAKQRASKWRTAEMQAEQLSDKQQKAKAEDFINEEDLTLQVRVVDQVIRDNTLHQSWSFKVNVFAKAMHAFAQSQLELSQKASHTHRYLIQSMNQHSSLSLSKNCLFSSHISLSVCGKACSPSFSKSSETPLTHAKMLVKSFDAHPLVFFPNAICNDNYSSVLVRAFLIIYI